MSFSDDSIDVKKKINLLGDPAVGKTSLILRFVNSVFGEKYLKTIGTNIYSKKIQGEDNNIKLIIHDIMGEKAYRSVQRGAFMGSTGAIAVADVTRLETLDSIMDDWLPRYREVTDEDNPVILAINKDDLEEKEITKDRLEEKTQDFERFFFTSAKSGKNVEESFAMLAENVAPRAQFQIEDIEDVVEAGKIRNTKDLIDALLAYSSELGDIPYFKREKLLEKSGIDKYSLDQEDELDLEIFGGIKEEHAFRFADELIGWYEEKGDDYSISAIKGLLKKYKEEKE